MKFMTALYTDVGRAKKTNQDSMLLQQAVTAQYGDILFAAMCDGMGGLARGELASAEAVRILSDWFKNSLPRLLDSGFRAEALKQEWDELIKKMDYRISDYGYQNRTSMGTTLAALLIIGQNYYIANVGDSRIYLLSDQIYQLTRDQTVVQREIDMGRLTPEQAAADPRRSVLLQCIGASEGVAPDFFVGSAASKQVFLLCCDGFRHVVSPAELYDQFNYRAFKKESVMEERLAQFTELIKQRGETDNISAILVRAG